MFISGNTYTKKDLYKILKVPIEQQKGNWNTGYTTYGGNIYIFCNIGVAGRTGHDYNNHWDNEELIWYGKTGSKTSQPLIKRLLQPASQIYIFTRDDSSLPFTFRGTGRVKSIKDSSPVEIIWSIDIAFFKYPSIIPEEIYNPRYEGSTVKISVNKYERNQEARQECIDHYGCFCQICGFNFEIFYGKLGKEIIHVHHIKPLSEIKEEYVINPKTDLIPVCPNCHSMIHRKTPCYTISEISQLIAHKCIKEIF